MSGTRIIELPKITDPRGNLTYVQFKEQLPFEVKRVFWTYDVPGGEQRGGHAYYEQEELIIALSGSFDVVAVDQDLRPKRVHLNRSYVGLYLPALTWRHVENFSTNALILHVASTSFDDADYIYDFEMFKNIKRSRIGVHDGI